jgi:hypothetical protein
VNRIKLVPNVAPDGANLRRQGFETGTIPRAKRVKLKKSFHIYRHTELLAPIGTIKLVTVFSDALCNARSSGARQGSVECVMTRTPLKET